MSINLNEWRSLSCREIGKRIGVSHETARQMRLRKGIHVHRQATNYDDACNAVNKLVERDGMTIAKALSEVHICSESYYKHRKRPPSFEKRRARCKWRNVNWDLPNRVLEKIYGVKNAGGLRALYGHKAKWDMRRDDVDDDMLKHIAAEKNKTKR